VTGVTAVAELRVPPGRAGRLWLQRRLSTARLAADLLDRKLRILRTEQARLAARSQDTEAAWDRAGRAADVWGLRAALLGGRRELRLAAVSAATVEITWSAVMGLRYPAAVTCQIPDQPAGGREPGTSAVIEAATAYRVALRAATDHAAARAALRAVDAEVAATRRRWRAVTQRWIPRLEGTLRELSQRLDEAERAEGVRRLWARPQA
jgi:V/A-type H+-transporting ATPase subunit D